MIADDIQKRLGENLKRIRKSKNLTQFQLAELADISEETVKNIELCRCWTSEKNLAKITEALNIDVHKLFLPVESSIQKDSENISQIKQTIAEELKSYIELKLNEIIRQAFLYFTLYKIHVIIYLSEMPKFQAAAPNSNLVYARNKDQGGCAMKAKIIYLIFTVVVGIATIVSAIFAVLSYYKK